MPLLQALGVPARFLNCDLSSVSPTSRMSSLEQRILGKWFHRERLSLGPPQRWLNREWELRLGSVGGTIYKVGLETTAGDYEQAVEFASRLHHHLTETFGSPDEHGEGVWLWDAADGNVVMQVANVMDESRVMIFLTSSSVREFQRK